MQMPILFFFSFAFLSMHIISYASMHVTCWKCYEFAWHLVVCVLWQYSAARWLAVQYVGWHCFSELNRGDHISRHNKSSPAAQRGRPYLFSYESSKGNIHNTKSTSPRIRKYDYSLRIYIYISISIYLHNC